MVGEAGVAVAVGVGQRDPELQAVQPAGVAGRDCSEWAIPWPAVIRLSWPGPDRLHAAEAVAVLHLALDQPGHRLQAGVRVRRHLHARPRR